MGYNLLINGIYWGYNPFTNHLLTSWDIQARQTPHLFDSRKLPEKSVPYLKMRMKVLHLNRKGPPGATGVVGKIAQKRGFF